MSSRKRPLAELFNSQTPARHAPSTPHALYALQQRSGAMTRSHRKRRALSEDLRPDSARGILRRLAKITAPLTRKTVPTPATARGKENRESDQAETTDDGLKRSRLFLDVDDSLDEIPQPTQEEEEDSELPVPPTPSILPGDDDDSDHQNHHDPSITFQSIDFAAAPQSHEDTDRRISRISAFGAHQQNDADDDDEHTILTEIGRRAISEEPTGRLSRYSFGSLRMSDFGSELEIRRESGFQDQTNAGKLVPPYAEIAFEDGSFDVGGETEHLNQLQKSPTPPAIEESTMNIPDLDQSFQFELVVDTDVAANSANRNPAIALAGTPPVRASNDITATEASPGLEEASLQLESSIEAPELSLAPQNRRKRVKMTRHGEMVPGLPASLMKRVAIDAQARLGNRKPKLGKDHMKALEQATEWFFEQIGEDLAAYSNHARRKKRVDRSDVLMLMQRQRVLQADGELHKAARELLPKEALGEFEENEL
ncbi:hypothetical protein PV08_08501 [Exophiala spinifera]|uniref:CENP-T/Histone H4 histone fold domain-containing protein n=1 Tax=Exophiala spinifera TaxID=91928 RepID=A0A0D2B2Z9_9EURO|nr:uncharacterized protein PV08_08501 [Exophiala spinifera]KIW13313.1 hypothetical protein PV08_08501 [Exophiala spinifera]